MRRTRPFAPIVLVATSAAFGIAASPAATCTDTGNLSSTEFDAGEKEAR